MKKASGAFPFIGHLPYLIKDPLTFLEKMMIRTNGRFYIKLGPKIIYFFTDPQDIKKIYIDYRDEMGKSMVRQSFGSSNLTSEGEVWNRHFRFSRTFFVKNNLENIFPLIHNEIQAHVKGLKEKRSFMLQEELFNLINTLVVKLFYSGRSGVVKIPELNKSIDVISKHITIATILPFRIPSWLKYPGKKKFLAVEKNFHDFIDEMTANSQREDCNTLLAHILKDPQITPEEIRIQALTFYMAGFETTANALFWTVKLILEKKSVMEKIKNEVGKVDLTGIDSFEKLDELKYVTACLNEGLRLYPPAWFRTREVKNDFIFENEFKIKKKSHVVVSPYLTQRNEKYFKDAEKFVPERFLNQSLEKYIFFPFSSGKNICTGRDLAWAEMILYLAYIFKELDLDNIIVDIPAKAAITIRPIKDIKIEKKLV